MLIPVLSAQDIQVSGRVTSAEDNETMVGVTVVLKGTSAGTTTDINGNYTINAPSDGVLVFTFIGMEPVEISISGRKVIDVAMNMAKVDLGEVVVMGYSTDSRKLISSSVGLVYENEIREVPLRTIDGVLQGKAAGLNIFQNSGTPGGQPTITIRGGSSLLAINTPLFVVDGIPLIVGEYGQVGFSGQEINALSDINPNDIESVTILKDASATAIYGARASNGVVLITTKKGTQKRTAVNYNGSYGWQTMPSERLLSLMNAEQWNEYRETDVQGIDTDWMSEILQVGPTTNHELSVSGGDEKTRFFLSGSYFGNTGVVMGTDYKRTGAMMNVDHNIRKNLKVGGGITISYSKNARVEGDGTLNGPLPNAMSIPAIYPVYNPDGTYNEDGPYANPVAIAKEATNNAFTNRTTGNIFLEYKFLDHFTFTTKWGADIYYLREHSYDPATTRQGNRYNGLGIEGTSYVSNLVSNNVLQYTNSFNEKHNLDALFGYSFEKYATRTTYIEGIDFPNEDFQYLISAGTIRYADATASDRGLNSWFGQFKYNYDYRYIFTLTGRFDGSSKFGTNNRYGFFPAASFAWRMSQESFMENASAISDLKIRLNVGLTGNDGIPNYAYQGLYGGGYNYGGNSGIAPIQLPNPDLKWETTRQTGLGLDLGLFQDRLVFNADVYYNRTFDLLLNRPIPPSSGFYDIYSNIGELENKGLELLANARVIDSDFKWNLSLNFAANRNKVLSLYNDQPIDDLGRGGNRVEVGEPMGIFYGLNCLGVDPTTGNLVYEDLNGDGIITSDDRMKTGDPNPDFTMGLTNTFTFKSFDLSIFLYTMYGNDVFNGTFIYLESGTGEDQQTTTMVDRWMEPGDVTNVPRVGDPYKSSRFIEDGSHMRIKNVTLGYNFSDRLLGKIHLKNARVYVSGQNLYTFTVYKGMDPEVNYYGGSSNIVLGTDFFTYPQVRTILVGLNLGF